LHHHGGTVPRVRRLVGCREDRKGRTLEADQGAGRRPHRPGAVRPRKADGKEGGGSAQSQADSAPGASPDAAPPAPRKGESRQKRSLPLWQREKVQELLPEKARRVLRKATAMTRKKNKPAAQRKVLAGRKPTWKTRSDGRSR